MFCSELFYFGYNEPQSVIRKTAVIIERFFVYAGHMDISLCPMTLPVFGQENKYSLRSSLVTVGVLYTSLSWFTTHKSTLRAPLKPVVRCDFASDSANILETNTNQTCFITTDWDRYHRINRTVPFSVCQFCGSTSLR